jgi:hypothetical protein
MTRSNAAPGAANEPQRYDRKEPSMTAGTRFRTPLPWRGLAIGLALFGLLAASAHAQVSVPNTFTPNTPAQSSQVNANFDTLEAAITTNQAGVAANAAAIPGLQGDVQAIDTALAALEARIAALETPPCTDRFCACSDGLTVEDTATGLLWERKTTDVGSEHNVDNTYSWSTTGSAADGTAYSVFLADLNTSGFAGQSDWRLPAISELQSILVGSGVTTVANADPADSASGTNPTGQATTCGSAPCIDPGFAAVGGPTASSSYWSASTIVTGPSSAWSAFFGNGGVLSGSIKTFVIFVRAVRAGSCAP